MRPVHLNFQRRVLQQRMQRTSSPSDRGTWSLRANNFDDSDDSDNEDDEEDELSSISTSVDGSELTTSTSSRAGDLSVDTSSTVNYYGKQHVDILHRQHRNTNTTVAVPQAYSKNSLDARNDQPPTPWGESTAKMRIIDELKNPTSDIHLIIGHYTDKDFKNVNFSALLQHYAGNKYKPSQFRENMKRVLVHLQNKTGPFKEVQRVTKVEQWYTSSKNVSKAYSLLFTLHMDEAAYRGLARMSVEEIWQSDPLFQQYELKKFKEYHKNMEKRTNKRKQQLLAEKQAYESDMKKLPRSRTTSRGYPFWHTHKASELLDEDEECGKAKRLTPKELWKSREEYQAFPLSVFRGHIYQLRTKRLAAPYWQYKRNTNARKEYEETEKNLKDWQVNTMTGGFNCMSLR